MTEEERVGQQIQLAPIEDEVVGLIRWDAKFGWWSFSTGLTSGNSISAYVFPNNRNEPLSEFRINTIRVCTNWVRENESRAKRHVTDRMFAWWFRQCWSDDSTDDGVLDEDGVLVNSVDERDERAERERFESGIYLGCLHFKEDECVMCYETGDLMNAHSFFVIIGPDCKLPEKVMWG